MPDLPPPGLTSSPDGPLPLRAVVLRDVQGLYGGHAVWARPDSALVQVVTRARPAGGIGLWEKRLRVPLTSDQWAGVERLAGKHHLLTLVPTVRPGLPDEGRPRITLLTGSGALVTVQKWANDRHADFDPPYRYLLGLCCLDGSETICEGPYEGQQPPAGFDELL